MCKIFDDLLSNFWVGSQFFLNIFNLFLIVGIEQNQKFIKNSLSQGIFIGFKQFFKISGLIPLQFCSASHISSDFSVTNEYKSLTEYFSDIKFSFFNRTDPDVVQVFMEVDPDYVTTGSDVTFKCIVEGDEDATVSWEKGDGPLPARSQVSRKIKFMLLNFPYSSIFFGKSKNLIF